MNKLADASGTPSFRREKWLSGTTGVLIPFRQAAKRPSALRHPRRHGSSAQIRSQEAKRKYSIVCFEALTNCYWGAKRARSALGAGRSSSNKSGGSSSSTCTRRDWANLGDGPAGLIAEIALASDVADYVRFRAVCKPWRQCSPDPRAGGGLDARFLPRRWIMLDKALAGSSHHRFLNVSTGECIRMGLPELLEGEHRFLKVTPEGLLLLFHKSTKIARLLNPLTRQLIDLPPLTAFVRGGDCDERQQRGPFVQTVGLTEDSTVAVSFCYPMKLAFAKPGDDNWTVVNEGYIDSALPFAGRFYCATNRGIMVLNNTSEQQQQPPRLTMVADLNKSFIYFSRMMHSLHLVDNGGELMLVHRTIGQGKCREYDVYRLDFEAGILIPVKRLNGRAVFMGMQRTISVSVEAFPYVSADTIYLGYGCDRNTEEYNIADGSRYSRSRIYDGSVSPDTIVQSLICYCIKDKDI
ncbi:uncharacterized protein LOC8061824 [Sorghum bicolor]|uniref:KIB1-4 beta-propeller domain-containing protein n=1 Tax=Sorghum bicolor TaxID=4558 RepID=A0A1B6Q588_SORBI|nr:uncharacterized protein LOC8061824 [Sorghum bicolor]XP_021311358.1 uncharacterized protein LOC8061824 [Sorghum bicolor]XP_021311359.1 uncharacterized protein LOC8061824 [Sorghum bicolor]XP_021311360.1 uncharacterized protein LOC8061824 [Sorghum bicolor]KXG33055.1 hypothetical protein SORBI_3003G248000 [Sorghum bicolor]|eukprot:XP_002456100.2 uncharacterized protein LOC8061824 [Sorghum bicolor]